MIILVDNYDSFTYNLVQRLGEIDPAVDLRVVRNDQVTLDEIEARHADSPDHFARTVYACASGHLERCDPAVRAPCAAAGVCLGHQCIGHALGATVVRAGRIMHGKTSLIHHDGRGVYRGLPIRSRPRAITVW